MTLDEHDKWVPAASRTAAATAARMKKSEERKAEDLRARGWVCLPPGGRLGATLRFEAVRRLEVDDPA